jgi:hypothetical protein
LIAWIVLITLSISSNIKSQKTPKNLHFYRIKGYFYAFNNFLKLNTCQKTVEKRCDLKILNQIFFNKKGRIRRKTKEWKMFEIREKYVFQSIQNYFRIFIFNINNKKRNLVLSL